MTGKLALVTGGSSGIGAACAAALAAEGAGVVAAARRFAPGALRVPAPGAISEVQLDVTDEDAVRARFAELPALDVLVCSAGVGMFAPVATASAADLRAMLEVHVVGTLLCAREALRRMLPRKAGHIVVIGSHAALRAFPDCAAYTAAKAGQLGLVRVLAEEARPHGIRVTNLMPGATDTPIWDDRPGFDRAKMMRPEDVASFLLAIVSRPGIAVEEVIVTPPAGAL
jgi:3-oxoacyl-[acyl-carrier protein] reductase